MRPVHLLQRSITSRYPNLWAVLNWSIYFFFLIFRIWKSVICVRFFYYLLWLVLRFEIYSPIQHASAPPAAPHCFGSSSSWIGRSSWQVAAQKGQRTDFLWRNSSLVPQSDRLSVLRLLRALQSLSNPWNRSRITGPERLFIIGLDINFPLVHLDEFKKLSDLHCNVWWNSSAQNLRQCLGSEGA